MIQLPMPPSNNRYYRHFRGRTVLAHEGKVFKDAVAWLCQAAGMRPLLGDVELYVIMHPRLTTKGAASKIRLDLDGCLKATCDALNGVLYADDKQITRLIAEIGDPLKDGGLSVQVRSMQSE